MRFRRTSKPIHTNKTYKIYDKNHSNLTECKIDDKDYLYWKNKRQSTNCVSALSIGASNGGVQGALFPDEWKS